MLIKKCLFDLLQKVPKSFVKLHWKEVSNPLFLTLPNGTKHEICWVERKGDIWFQKKWGNFAKCLKYGHLLIFKYLGGPYFKVKIFGDNNIEIDYSNIKSVDEVGEAKEGSDDSETLTQTRRTKNGKKKVNVDFDSTHKKISGEFI